MPAMTRSPTSMSRPRFDVAFRPARTALPFDFEQRLGHRLRIAPVVGDFLRVVAGERRLDRFLIEDGDRRRTVAADRFGADVDRRAAAGTVDRADARGKRLDLHRRQLADEALLDHELGEDRETPVFLQAALVGEAAALGDVEHREQRVVAARTVQPGRVRHAHFVAVRVDQLEQLDDPAGTDLVALEFVEPDALAGEAEVEARRGRLSRVVAA
jgi:hypothetical protein